MATEPLDMRANTETKMARVVSFFDAARSHHAHPFANRRADHMKALVHDGSGVWLAARRLNSRKLVWPCDAAGTALLSLRRFETPTRFGNDAQLPVDNNWIEHQIRPIAIGRNNWLFVGSLRAGERAAGVMSLSQSARMNGHDPYAYL